MEDDNRSRWLRIWRVFRLPWPEKGPEEPTVDSHQYRTRKEWKGQADGLEHVTGQGGSQCPHAHPRGVANAYGRRRLLR